MGGVTPDDPLRGWRAVPGLVARTVVDARRDRVLGLAAEVAFFVLLSLPPALLAVLGALGFVSSVLGPDVTESIRERILDVAGTFLTESTSDEIVKPTLDTLLRGGRADVASVGVVLTLWSASRATTRLMEAVTIAYDVEDRRSALRRRLLALGLTLGGMLGVVIVVPILVAGPRLVEAVAEPLGLAGVLGVAWRFLYWPVVGLLGIGLLASFFHLATPIDTPWRRDLPGAAAAVILWLLFGVGLRLYATTIEAGTYGPLAAPVVILLWLYVTGLAVLLGAELNAEIEKLWPAEAGHGPGEEGGEETDEEPAEPDEAGVARATGPEAPPPAPSSR